MATNVQQYNGPDQGTGGDSATQDLNVYYEVRIIFLLIYLFI